MGEMINKPHPPTMLLGFYRRSPSDIASTAKFRTHNRAAG